MKNIWKVFPALRKTYQSGHASPQLKEGRGAWKVLLQALASSSSGAMYSTASGADPSRSPGSECRTDGPAFVPRKALVLTKFSRYEFEKRRHADLTEEELIKDRNTSVSGFQEGVFDALHSSATCIRKRKDKLEARGSDYNSLLHHHKIHTKNRELVVSTLKQRGIETRLVDRFDYTDSNVEWADVVFTTGGDGTFLMAASKIYTRDKPVIGINSDPSRSIGYLCLPGHYTENFPLALERLLTGKFQWMWRQRMRVTLKGEHAFDAPVELHDQQLQYPEYRFLDCWQEQHHRRDGTPTPRPTGDDTSRVLPVRSLNEVFVGETLSSRVSYYELSIDGLARIKLKSSGLTVCTGTGSTSWSFNINKVTPQCVQQILDIVGMETGLPIPTRDQQLIERVTTKFNNSLIFDPSKSLMAYTIRDPVVFGTDFSSKPRGFAKRIEVKSRMFDACLVIDGGLSFVFNDGATAVLELHDEDALRTVQFAD